jgi:branched-chain amino acid transport system permease protein
MVTGLIFIVCVLLFRRGIVGEIGALFERMGRKAPAASNRVAAAADREAA